MEYGMILLKCFYDYDLLIILQKNNIYAVISTLVVNLLEVHIFVKYIFG